ncbi:unnamed protein product [Lupinus luteus]|uniref:RNase H type-1 domain-containing protein n=1 Tax=Lupinus luteus TaxID=3873 RepID=A0AAV1YB18_LUPLU
MWAITKQERSLGFLPSENSYKVNVDGSSFGNPSRLGFGGLIRNNLGEWISGFSGFCGIASNLHAGLLAIFHGLNLSWSSGFKAIICESDSQLALTLIAKGLDRFHPHEPVINKIRNFMYFPWSLTLNHTLRETNECADWLAKHGAANDLHLFR